MTGGPGHAKRQDRTDVACLLEIGATSCGPSPMAIEAHPPQEPVAADDLMPQRGRDVQHG